jgi:hypothetical protein
MATNISAQTVPTASPIAPQIPLLVQVDTPAAGGHILTVGPNGEFADLWDAIAQAHDNDVIAVQAGTYVDDSNSRQNGYVNAKNVTIEGVGGMVHIVEAPGSQPYNQKAPIVATNGLTLKNFEISGVTARGLNGAGLRIDSGNVKVEDCYFHDDQDGILGAGGGNVTIDHSEFAYNGQGGGGSAHDVYIGSVDGAKTASLTFTNNYVHDSEDQGHLLKTRAQVNDVENNVLADQNGNGSYDIDIPNGGVSTIKGNLIVKGPNTVNAYVIHYGGETQFSYATNSLVLAGNTIAYERGKPTSPVGVLNQISLTTGKPAVPVSVTNNAFYNLPVSDVLAGAGTVTGSTVLQAAPGVPTTHPWASAPVIQGPATPLTLVLDNPVGVAHGISGGASGATITDNVGATIDSGAAGIHLTENQTGQITTRVGTANTIVLNGSGSTLSSAGSDTITDNGKCCSFTVSGRSTLSIGSNAWGYTVTLNGQETVTTAADGVFHIGSGANVTINTISGSYGLLKPLGATVALNESYVQWGTNFTAYATASGGAALLSWANRVLTMTAQDKAADSFTYRGGSVAMVAGAGTDTFTIAYGQHPGSLEIKGYKTGVDSIVYQGWTGNPVTSARMISGNTVLTLEDGSTVQVDGVALNAPVAPPAIIQGGTAGAGSDTLTVDLSEDAYQGDAQASISIDGKLLTATPVTVTARKSAGQTEAFSFKGSFGAGPHKVSVTFLNDAWGGTPALDRNLYADSVTLDGISAGMGAALAGVTSSLSGSTELHTTASAAAFSVTGGTNAALAKPGAAAYAAPAVAPATVPAASVVSTVRSSISTATLASSTSDGGTLGSGPDTLTVTLAEDAYQGDAQANVTIDGQLLTATPVTVTALYGRDASEQFTLKGTFGSGSHQVGVSFLNDAWGGSSATDRNLYVEGVFLNGTSAGMPTATAGAVTSPTSGVTEFHTAGSSASFTVAGGTASTNTQLASSGSGAVTFAPSQYVTAGNVLQYDSNQAWSATAEAEFNGPAPGVGPNLPQGGAGLVFGNTNGAPYQGYEEWEDDNGDLRVRIMSNFLAGDYIDVATNSPVTYGKMQFIGATYDGSGKAAGVSIYVDGQKAQTHVLSDSLSGSSASSGPMIVGNQLNGWESQFNLQGMMAEFSLSDVARPASYYAAATQQGAFAIDAATQLAYGFAEGAGLTTKDLSGHGNSGTLSSTTMWTQTS